MKSTNMQQKVMLATLPLILVVLMGCPDSSQCSGPDVSQCSSSSQTPNTSLVTPILASAYPGDTSASLTWYAVFGATSYDVYRSGVKIGTTSSTSFADSNLVNGQTYSYCIVAASSMLQSIKSNCISVTPLPQQVFAVGSVQFAGWNYFFDSANNLYSASANGGILRTSSAGVQTIFFSGMSVFLITKDSMDNVYVLVDSTGDFQETGSDAASISIQEISATGAISTFCSSSNCRSVQVVQGIAGGGGVIDSQGNLIVPIVVWDPYPNVTNNTFAFEQIAKISPSGAYSILSGASVAAGDDRCIDGDSAHGTFSGIVRMSIDRSDNIYIFDQGINSVVCYSLRKISPSGVVTTTYSFGSTRAGGPTWDSSGNVYFGQYDLPSNGVQIQKLSSTGVLSTYCGGATYPSPATGNCTQTFLPAGGLGLAFDNSDNLYFPRSANVGVGSYTLYKVIPH